jgi:hypothetical protein
MSSRRYGHHEVVMLIMSDDFPGECVRVAEHSTRKMLIEELLNRTRLEKLLRDSYGNYCVQVRTLVLATIFD